jgi:hypothetical protein
MDKEFRIGMGTNTSLDDMIGGTLWIRIAENGVFKDREHGRTIYTFKYAYIRKIVEDSMVWYEINWYNDDDSEPETISHIGTLEQSVRVVKDNYRRASSSEEVEILSHFASGLLGASK